MDSYRSLEVLAYRGKTVSQITDRVYNLSRAVVDLQADVVYVLLGTNNISGRSACSQQQFATAFNEFIDAVKYKFTRAHVIVNVILPRLDIRPTLVDKLAAFNKEINCISVRCGCTVISSPWDTARTDPRVYLAKDRLHLSYRGNVMFKKIVKANIHAFSHGFASLPHDLLCYVEDRFQPTVLPLSSFPNNVRNSWNSASTGSSEPPLDPAPIAPLTLTPVTASQEEASPSQYFPQPVQVKRRTYASVTSRSLSVDRTTPNSHLNSATTVAHSPIPSVGSHISIPVTVQLTSHQYGDSTHFPHLTTNTAVSASASATASAAVAVIQTSTLPAASPPTPSPATSNPPTTATSATAHVPLPSTPWSRPASAPILLKSDSAPCILAPGPDPSILQPVPPSSLPIPVSVPTATPPAHSAPPTQVDASIPPNSASSVLSKCPGWLRKRLAYYKNLLSVPILKEVEVLLLAKVEQGMFVRQGINSSKVLLFGQHKYVYNRPTQQLAPIPIVSHPILQTVLSIVNIKLKSNFNSILVNFYEDPSVVLPYHKDDERHLDKSAKIATLSIGATRNMDFATCKRERPSYSQQLLSNSLFVMHPETQVSYFHRIASGHCKGYRFSLTFRTLKPSSTLKPCTLDMTEGVLSYNSASLQPRTLDKTEGVLSFGLQSSTPGTLDKTKSIHVLSSASFSKALIVPTDSFNLPLSQHSSPPVLTQSSPTSQQPSLALSSPSLLPTELSSPPVLTQSSPTSQQPSLALSSPSLLPTELSSPPVLTQSSPTSQQPSLPLSSPSLLPTELSSPPVLTQSSPTSQQPSLELSSPSMLPTELSSPPVFTQSSPTSQQPSLALSSPSLLPTELSSPPVLTQSSPTSQQPSLPLSSPSLLPTELSSPPVLTQSSPTSQQPSLALSSPSLLPTERSSPPVLFPLLTPSQESSPPVSLQTVFHLRESSPLPSFSLPTLEQSFPPALYLPLKLLQQSKSPSLPQLQHSPLPGLSPPLPPSQESFQPASIKLLLSSSDGFALPALVHNRQPCSNIMLFLSAQHQPAQLGHSITSTAFSPLSSKMDHPTSPCVTELHSFCNSYQQWGGGAKNQFIDDEAAHSSDDTLDIDSDTSECIFDDFIDDTPISEEHVPFFDVYNHTQTEEDKQKRRDREQQRRLNFTQEDKQKRRDKSKQDRLNKTLTEEEKQKRRDKSKQDRLNKTLTEEEKQKRREKSKQDRLNKTEEEKQKRRDKLKQDRLNKTLTEEEKQKRREKSKQDRLNKTEEEKQKRRDKLKQDRLNKTLTEEEKLKRRDNSKQDRLNKTDEEKQKRRDKLKQDRLNKTEEDKQRERDHRKLKRLNRTEEEKQKERDLQKQARIRRKLTKTAGLQNISVDTITQTICSPLSNSKTLSSSHDATKTDKYDRLQHCQTTPCKMFTSPLRNSHTVTTPTPSLPSPGPNKSPESTDRVQNSHDKPDFEVIAAFRTIMKEYPEYECANCNTLNFRQNVVKFDKTSAKSGKQKTWICKRCNSYRKSNKICPLATIPMKLETGSLPDNLVMNPTETRLVAMRIQFMKIRSLPAGGQRGIRGAVVNVPIDAQESCLKLPRNIPDLGVLKVKIKRDVSHKTVVLVDDVDPKKCINVLIWLKKHNPLYTFTVLNDDWIKGKYNDHQDFFNVHFADNARVIASSLIDEIIANICNEGTYDQLPYEHCIQHKDPLQNFIHEVPVMDFAPGQGKTPIPALSDSLAEPLSFPNLFPLGKGHFHDSDRQALIASKAIPKLSRKQYAKHRLYSADRKFAMDPEYIFFTQACVERESIYNAASIHLQKSRKVSTEGIRLTAGLFTNKLISTEQLLNNIDAFRYMKDVKGTPAFWQRVKSDALGMVSQLGTFTWFLTFSFNDLVYSIPAILTLMGIEPSDQLLTDISWHRKHELLRTDPVIAVRMFDRYIRKIVSFLLEKKKILGATEAYTGRDEFGDRGSPHFHMMLKCIGAPIVGVDSIETIIKYIDKYITTKKPSPEEDPVLSALVKLQTHSHTKTCRKGVAEDACRFFFPRPFSRRTIIVDADGKEMTNADLHNISADRNKGRKSRVIYIREIGAEYINPYNETLLRCLESNIDVQYIVGMWDMVNYLVNYATKTEKDVCDAMKDVKNNIMHDENKNARDKLRSLGNVFIDARSVSIQESVFRTTDLPMKFSFPRVIFVPSDMPDQRHGMLKFRRDMENMPEDSDDIFMKGYIDRYPQRPDSLKDMCYKEFAVHYEKCPNITKSNVDRIIHLKDPTLGTMIRRTGPQIVRSHTPSRKTDPEKYYYSKICLYFPWTDEAQILGNYSTVEQSFVAKYDVIKLNMKKFEHIDEATLESMISEITEDILNSHVPLNVHDDKLDPRGLASHPPNDLKREEDIENFKFTYEEPPITEQEYNSMVSSLNEKQRDIFSMIQTHAENSNDGNKVNQLIHFISGAGGVGKSFLITAIRHCINRTFKRGSHNSAVLVSASTGVAAALIDGQTVHKLLQLDCQEGGFFNQKSLNSAKRDKMFNAIFKHVRYLIIDEVSMIGNTNLNQIHSRLNQLFGMSGAQDYFGGINIIFVGDLFQIPPVQQSKIFDPRGLAALGINFWKDFCTFSELNEVVRSKGDAPFTELCHRLRTGQHTVKDVSLLQSRVITNLPKVSQLMDSMLLFSTNAKCSEHNKKCVDYLTATTKVHNIMAHDKFSNEQFNNSNQTDKRDKKNIKDYVTDDINKTAGLPTSIILGVGARVMVRANIDVTDKLCNGVCGTVKHIKFKNSPENSINNNVSVKVIDKVYIKFDMDKVGRKIKHLCNKFCHKNCTLADTVPISPVEKQFKCKKVKKTNVWLKRYQLPLTLCWASTIHKCQGVTLQNAYIDLSGINWKAGMAYTAISRLTSMAGLFLISFDKKCIRTDPQIVREYERLRSLPPFQLNVATSDIIESPSNQPSDSPLISSLTSTRLCSQTLRSPPSPLNEPPSKKQRVVSPTLPNSKRASPPSPIINGSRKCPRLSSPAMGTPNLQFNNLLSKGKAYVIDFNNDPQSSRFATQLATLGFNVQKTINNFQESVSCGYIAARVIAKLHSATISNLNCFEMDVLDCNYDGRNSAELDMVAVANIHLGLPGTKPHFLYASQCLTLITFYSMLYYNKSIATINFHDLNIEQPLSKSSFIHKINQIAVQDKTIPPTFFTVNASDQQGTHWFVVVIEKSLDSQNEQ